MNGANAVPPRKTRPARTRSANTMGIIHHFLLVRRNIQKSASSPGAGCEAIDSNRSRFGASFTLFFLRPINFRLVKVLDATRSELAEVSICVIRWLPTYPVRACRTVKRALHG